MEKGTRRYQSTPLTSHRKGPQQQGGGEQDDEQGSGDQHGWGSRWSGALAAAEAPTGAGRSTPRGTRCAGRLGAGRGGVRGGQSKGSKGLPVLPGAGRGVARWANTARRGGAGAAGGGSPPSTPSTPSAGLQSLTRATQPLLFRVDATHILDGRG